MSNIETSEDMALRVVGGGCAAEGTREIYAEAIREDRRVITDALLADADVAEDGGSPEEACALRAFAARITGAK